MEDQNLLKRYGCFNSIDMTKISGRYGLSFVNGFICYKNGKIHNESGPAIEVQIRSIQKYCCQPITAKEDDYFKVFAIDGIIQK